MSAWAREVPSLPRGRALERDMLAPAGEQTDLHKGRECLLRAAGSGSRVDEIVRSGRKYHPTG